MVSYLCEKPLRIGSFTFTNAILPISKKKHKTMIYCLLISDRL
jgi:hypothetical protein